MKLKTTSVQLRELRTLLEDTEVTSTSDMIILMHKSKIDETHTCTALSVCFDGTNYWLFDGYHRLAAMQSLGFNTCEVKIYKGSRRDALRRYIKDKLKCIGHNSQRVFKHCLNVLSEDKEWSNTDAQTLSRLFDRKPAFFESVSLYKIQKKPGNLVCFSINKHGTFNLLKR